MELLFPDAYDSQYNLATIIDYIYESWPLTDSSGRKIKTWTDLFEYKNYPKAIISHKNSLFTLSKLPSKVQEIFDVY
jgi:hypothetical protein